MSNNPYRANYVILSEKNLIIEFHDGLIIAELLIEYKKKQASHKDYSPDRNFLVDLRFAEFTKRADKVQKYVDYLSNHSEIAGVRNVALIADSPDPVVMGKLYQYMQSSLPQNLQIFATMENAIRWLDLDISAKTAFEILDELRTQSNS
jgi:hypothetical protein